MEVNLPENVDFEAVDPSIIDLSSETEFQFPDPNAYDLRADARAEEIAGTTSAIKHFPILYETTEPEITQRKGKYNLRKSLAWDSAFFSSAGVLDPEELSTMLKGAEKSDKEFLPRIEEDISGSNDSMSTFETDILAVDSLENDLFGDIRASIQRSNKKTSSSTNSSSKIENMETDSTAISSLQKEELASVNKNPKPALKKNSALQTIRMSKSQPKQKMSKLGSGKASKQDCGHSQVAQSMAKNGESNLVCKPPKAIRRPFMESAAVRNQDSLGRNRVKSECGSSKLVSEKVQPSKKPLILSGSRSPLRKPALASKSSLLRSSTTSTVQSTISHTSSDISSNMSSNAPAKSSLAAARRNPVKSSISGAASSSSIPKIPSRGALKNKPSTSTLSAYMKSTKISSSVSPVSSVSEWSSVSSSSSKIIQHSGIARTSLETDFCRSTSSDTILSDPRNHSAHRIADGLGNLELSLPGNSSTKSSTHAGTLAPAKPSGLRMPSPKIGYFEGVKSSVCTPKKTLQSPSSLHAVIPKSGAAVCTPNRNSNIKLKSDKTSIARTVGAAANTKPDFPRATNPTSSHSCVMPDVKDSVSGSLEVNGKKTGESSSEAQKEVVSVGAGPDATLHKNLGGLHNETDLNVNNNNGFAGVKIPLVEGINPSGCIGWRVDEDGRVEQNHLEVNSSQTCDTGDKENCHAKDEGEMLKVLNGDVNPYIPSSMAEILKEISDCASLPPNTATEFAVPRSPFAPICDNELLDAKESANVVADKTAFLLPSFEHNS